ncbi:MAG TPA: signal peptidase I [Polyangia bacterium]
MLRQAATLFGFCTVLLAARSSLADHYFVPTGSMIPTVAIGDRVLVNKVAYSLRLPFSTVTVASFAQPTPGDVVVLDSPEDGRTLLKRVVAVPGDEVEVSGGQLRINGRVVPVEGNGDSGPTALPAALIERLGKIAHPIQLTNGGGASLGPIRLPADEFLVMGDNRGESHDGRAFGPVKREAIRGRAWSVWLRDGRPCWRPL